MPRSTNQSLPVGEEAKVRAPFVSRLREAGQSVENLRVDLPRVGLAGDGEDASEAHLLRDEPVELLHILVVAVEEGEEVHGKNEFEIPIGNRKCRKDGDKPGQVNPPGA